MAIKRSVFGSASELKLFRAIESQWQHRFDIWPNLPFKNIIDVATLDVGPGERTYLFKASVDYTLCTKQGRPLLSIEFDGMSHGFSRRGRYVAIHPSRRDPKRTEKLDLKVSVASQVRYPLFVVSYHEKNPIGEKTHLTIVDGIIGQVLAHRNFRKRLSSLLAEEREALSAMGSASRHEYIQDLALFAETEAELEWDPLAITATDLEGQLRRRGIASSHRLSWLLRPEPPDIPVFGDPTFVDALEARIEGMKRAIRVGCKATIHTIFGDLEETAWVPNIEDFGVTSQGLAENIAMILACQRALDLADQRGKDQEARIT